MPNYNESTVSGAKWTRCRAVTINNGYNEVPEAYFQEQEIVVIDNNEVISRDSNFCKVVFDVVNGSIPLLDPATDLPTGATVTHAQLYAILYSLYMQTAQLRDSAQNT